MDLLLALPLGDPRRLVRGKSSAHGTRLLGSQIQRDELLVLVEEAQLGALGEVDDGQDARDRLANLTAVRNHQISYSVQGTGLHYLLRLVVSDCRPIFPQFFSLSTLPMFLSNVRIVSRPLVDFLRSISSPRPNESEPPKLARIGNQESINHTYIR